jgi:hypothetical protein
MIRRPRQRSSGPFWSENSLRYSARFVSPLGFLFACYISNYFYDDPLTGLLPCSFSKPLCSSQILVWITWWELLSCTLLLHLESNVPHVRNYPTFWHLLIWVYWITKQSRCYYFNLKLFSHLVWRQGNFLRSEVST